MIFTIIVPIKYTLNEIINDKVLKTFVFQCITDSSNVFVYFETGRVLKRELTIKRLSLLVINEVYYGRTSSLRP